MRDTFSRLLLLFILCLTLAGCSASEQHKSSPSDLSNTMPVENHHQLTDIIITAPHQLFIESYYMNPQSKQTRIIKEQLEGISGRYEILNLSLQKDSYQDLTLSIPIPEPYSQDLVIYQVIDENQIEALNTTIENGYASCPIQTSSIYVLADLSIKHATDVGGLDDTSFVSAIVKEEVTSNIPTDPSNLREDGLTERQYQTLTDYFNAYYSSIGNFDVQIPDQLFYSDTLKTYENTVWDSLIQVRKQSLIDLHLDDYKFAFRIEEMEYLSPIEVEMLIWEDCEQQFHGLEVRSKEANIDHEFTLILGEDGYWHIKDHTSGCNPFYVFTYDALTNSDLNLSQVLFKLSQRYAQFDHQTVTQVVCDHPYDRNAAIQYAGSWIESRNPYWSFYDDYGGNCMNFASQCLYAGGIARNPNWYNYEMWDTSLSWVNVGSFTEYLTQAKPQELCSDMNAPYYSGEPGDLLLIGIDEPENHATIIADVVTDSAGNTIDYLLYSNTSNLINYPASAYYYTNQRLVKIYGWND